MHGQQNVKCFME